ncbi:hypothetical protein PHLCEN_2v6858 [Hermanssonia centrifuga]|uniref:Uncharacterized protein n=1 Tax=Hermanssonia centrifuga TaxID=98765 RepID=A0A2R6NYA0_9APHY|nr:hypothetical protein PHLCEN_2v6858 [Hermanssonia centrifuga]
MRDKGKGKQSYLDSTKQGTDENGILSGLSSYPHDASLHSPETHRTELTSSSIDFGSEKLPDYPQLGSHLEAVMQGALETGGAACAQDTLPDSYTTVGEGTEDSNTAGCSEGSRCHAESSSSRSLPSAAPTVTRRADAGSSFASGSPSTSLTSAIDVLPPSPPPSVSAMSSSNIAPINTPNSPQHPSLPLVPGSSAISSHSTPIHNSPLLLHTGSGPGDIDDRNITTMMPGQILPFLNCPRCSQSALLEAPITLHCGHTVCSKHIGRPQNTSPPSPSLLSSILSSITPSSSDAASSSGSPIPLCPLPTCTRRSPDDASPVYLHPAAHVGITSAPLPPSEHPPAPSSSRPAPPRVDVTVNKIIVLVQRAIQASTLVEEDRVPTLGGDEDERTDSEDDFEDEEGHDHDDEEDALSSRPPTHSLDDDSPSGSRRLLPHPRSPSSRSRRPRKRPRLSHTSPSTRAPPRRLDRAGDAGTSFEKELLTELTCEICFALMWQPVTTPCQHVSDPKYVHIFQGSPPLFFPTFSAFSFLLLPVDFPGKSSVSPG